MSRTHASGTSRFALSAAGILLIVGLVAFIYRPVASAYFFNDDFQWLQGTHHFSVPNLVRIELYSHFYRPVVETYFYLGRVTVGCDPLAFHLASVAIHLVCAGLVFLLAKALSSEGRLAFLASVLFAVQPGGVEAVAWVGAITDQLPALWFLLAMWGHYRYLEVEGFYRYALTLLAFVACLLTHESSATLLPVLLALEALLMAERKEPLTLRAIGRRLLKYLPFALLLVVYLLIEWTVNSRSYVVREGHYRFGWHAIPNAFNYVLWLIVRKRTALAYGVTALGLAWLIWKGTPRHRFLVLWLAAALAPPSFFTWGNTGRYLYLPSAAFAILLADLLLRLHRWAQRRWSPRSVRVAALATITFLVARFAFFAEKGVTDFTEGTMPYQRLARVVRAAYPDARAGSTVAVSAQDLENIPKLYREPAVQAAFCQPDIHLVVREQ